MDRVAWDTCVLLDVLAKTDDKWPEIEPVYQAAVSGKLEIIISEIVVAETIKIGEGSDDDLQEIRSFLDNVAFRRYPVTSRESQLAQEYRSKKKLGTCDALILATAVNHGAKVLYTRDGDRKTASTKATLLSCHNEFGEPPLSILVPNAAEYLDQPLLAHLYGKQASK